MLVYFVLDVSSVNAENGYVTKIREQPKYQADQLVGAVNAIRRIRFSLRLFFLIFVSNVFDFNLF